MVSVTAFSIADGPRGAVLAPLNLESSEPELGVDPVVRDGSSWRPPTGRGGMIRLDLNENRFVPHHRLAELLRAVDPEHLTMYPEYDAAYSALASYSGRPRQQLLLSNGADQAIELVLRAFCPRRRVVLAVPTFSYYQHVAQLLGIELDKVAYDTKFELDLDSVLQALRRGADGVVLVSPSNPLGTALDRGFVTAVATEARRQGAFVLIDEVYYEFHDDSFADLLDTFSNVVLVRSFSKGFGLAGLRLGYVASAPENISQMEKLRGPWDVNALAVRVAAAALQQADWLDFVPTVRAERSLLQACLHEAGFEQWTSQTNFVVARHPLASQIANWLRAEGVLVADINQYPDAQGILANCLRIAVPNPTERDFVHSLLSRAPSACSSRS